MAPRFVVTVASYREIGLMRKRRKYVQISGWGGCFHFGDKSTLEGAPLLFFGDREVLFQEAFAWREIGKPHVIDVL